MLYQMMESLGNGPFQAVGGGHARQQRGGQAQRRVGPLEGRLAVEGVREPALGDLGGEGLVPDVQVKGNRSQKARQPVVQQLLGKAGHQGGSQHGGQHA